ncbi:Uncharacterized protein ChrSV_0380 [Chromobacterium vaccinii]|nr:Uncharacterized protein ChrSW_0380 [Chromobacterium vaccinii]QND87839.1 Uncharacterized protein ChrSV_0380 [Chromobacterium vaccinii]
MSESQTENQRKGKEPTGWTLGQTSKFFESGKRGAGAVSTGKGDHGGASYGAYQLSSKEGSVQEFIKQTKYKTDFQGLTPGSSEFNAKWKEIAAKDSSFYETQHDYIKKNYYEKQANRLKSSGMDMSNRGASIQDLLWSTSVQFQNRTKNIFQKSLQGKDISKLSDAEIITAVQNYKIANNNALFSKSNDNTRAGTLNRAKLEKERLLTLSNSSPAAMPKREKANTNNDAQIRPPLPAASNASNGNNVLNQRSRFSGYKYKLGGNGEKDSKGVNRIDCSHLVNQALTGAGYAIPYQTTAGMANSKYYEEVDAKDVKPGDIALWQGNKNHTGIVEAYDAKTGKGSFFGAQSKKGASSAQMGKGAWWGQPQKFLRPKTEYLKAPAQAQGKEAHAPAAQKPVAQAAHKPANQPKPKAAAANASQPTPQTIGDDKIQQLLRSEDKTRQYRLNNGTTETRTGGSRSWRDNNPGNMKFGFTGSEEATKHLKVSKAKALARAQKKYQGVVDLDHNGYAIFESQAAGRAAQAQLLFHDHANHSVEEMLPGYAMDDHSGKADHQKYAEMIYKTAAKRGLDLHGKKLKDMTTAERDALQDGMQRMEGFKAGKVDVSGTAHPAAQAQAAPPAAPAAKPLPKAAASANQPKVLPKPAAPPKKPAAASQAPAAAGNAAEAQLSALIAQLSAALTQLTQPLRVVVDVQNGNIVAAVNAANSQQQRRS